MKRRDSLGTSERRSSVKAPPSRNGGARFVAELLERRDLLTATLLKDLTAFDGASNPQQFVTAEGSAYFVASELKSGTTTYWLYRTDATNVGTAVIQSFSAAPRNLTASGGLAYYEVQGGARQVWRTDGSALGTVQLTNFTTANISTRNYTDAGGTLFFVVTSPTSTQLWKSSGTAATTAPVVDPAQFASLSNLASVGGMLYFTAAPSTNPSDVELWKSDGTDAGTIRVKDIAAGTAGSSPALLTNVNGTLYFLADDGVDGQGLWKSDGSDAGTVLVKADSAMDLSGAPTAIVGVAIPSTSPPRSTCDRPGLRHDRGNVHTAGQHADTSRPRYDRP